MLGKRSPQLGLFEADHLYAGFVGRDSFYGYLARHRGEIFRDEDFAEFYSPDQGRPSVPPSLLATALLLQTHDRVSDEEAKGRADYDLRWKVALGVGLDERPFAKSTLQLFRAQLVLREKMRMVFQRSLECARRSGYLKKRSKLRVVMDTTYILGRGAAKDTYNLLADGIRQLLRALAAAEGVDLSALAAQHGYERYLASSIKGEAEVDWDDEGSRQEFLQGVVEDGDRLLTLARKAMASWAEGAEQCEDIARAGALLVQLVDQDVERSASGIQLKEGVARDRIMSVHDPEMRHGRKSSSRRFDGHKGAIAVDAESQLITAVAVLGGNEPDNTGALDLVEASEQNAGLEVEETIGDCAYGDGKTRQAFADAQRALVARVARRGSRDQISKDSFEINLDEMSCTCPAGQTTRTVMGRAPGNNRDGQKPSRQVFAFDAEICAACRLRPQCVKAKGRKGRTIQVHPQERLLQEARALQQSPAFREYRQMRQVAEHRLARLVQLGIRRARYTGRRGTLFQLLMAATVANLTLVARRTEQESPQGNSNFSLSSFGLAFVTSIRRHSWHLVFAIRSIGAQMAAFRPGL
jgi:transposase